MSLCFKGWRNEVCRYDVQMEVSVEEGEEGW